MLLPSLSEIEQLHTDLAPDKQTFQLVYTHSHIVWELAAQLIERNSLNVDKAFIQAGCLLHDIGAYKFIRQGRVGALGDYIRHGIEGYSVLKEKGYPEALCRVCSHHTGVGITREKVLSEKLSLPVADYTAATLEEKLIMYADKFHSKTPQFNSYDYYKTYVSQFGSEEGKKLESLKKLFGIPDLEPLAKKYGMKIR